MDAKVDLQNKEGCTALLLAAKYGHLEIVKVLLAKDAKINVQDKEGLTALLLATQEGHLEIMKALLAKDAKVDLEDKDGWTAFVVAAKEGHADIVQALCPELDVDGAARSTKRKATASSFVGSFSGRRRRVT